MFGKRDGGRRRWEFSARECRAVLLMLPLMALLVWAVAEAVRPRPDGSAQLLGDAVVAGDAAKTGDADGADYAAAGGELFEFDPNEVTYEELRALGVAKGTAAGIIKYRMAGKVFRIPEDFATCYGITDSAYAVLKPYIRIGAEFALGHADTPVAKPVGEHVSESSGSVQDFRSDSTAVAVAERFDPNMLGVEEFVALGFTPAQARTIVNYREACGGFDTPEDLARSYVVSDEMYARLRDRMYISRPQETGYGETESWGGSAGKKRGEADGRPLLDINSADSASLVEVSGIGPVTAAAVVKYRRRLGGYSDIEQVLETGVVTERNWELMRGQIFADTCAIRKIDINFAAPDSVAGHPYITPRMLRRILRNRQLKGGWSTIEEMTKDNTLTEEQAARLAPYLRFGNVRRSG